MESKLEISIVCDNRDSDTIHDAIEALRDRIERMGDTYGTVEGTNYAIEIS